MTPPPSHPPKRRSWVPWAAVGCLVLVAAGVGQLYLTSRSEVQSWRDQQELTQTHLKSIQNQLDAERIVARRELANLTQEKTEAARQRDELGRQLKAQGDLTNLKITPLSSLLTEAPQARAVAVWNPTNQQGVLKVERLPALTPDRDYQLWIVDSQATDPVDGGTFQVDADGGGIIPFKAKRPIKAVVAYAITQERKGGVAKSVGPFVLLGKEPAP